MPLIWLSRLWPIHRGAYAITQAYATDCIAEYPTIDLIPFVDTNQAIRDIEESRLAIGAPKIWIYGES